MHYTLYVYVIRYTVYVMRIIRRELNFSFRLELGSSVHCDEYDNEQTVNTVDSGYFLRRHRFGCKGSASSETLDSEIVAWDVTNKVILPFQMLTTRKRKNIDIGEIKGQMSSKLKLELTTGV
uniref:ATP-dependent DNA ligase family profile domain-containing protein n=1 Tax=Glossina austeni TaxID=7395 RepID=A0A1A9UMS7_GLOAU